MGQNYWVERRQLRQELAADFELADRRLTLQTEARAYHIAVTQPVDSGRALDELLASLAQGRDQQGREAPADLHLEYWGLLWESGIALAEAVLARRQAIAGQRVLEVGCGLGVTATAALLAGASVLASDCFAGALRFCRYNALCNTGRAPELLLADWRTPAGQQQLTRHRPFAIVLAADVLYDEEDVRPLLHLLPQLAGGGQLWLADPGRAAAAAFIRSATDLGWQGTRIVVERDWGVGGGRAPIAVSTFRLPDNAPSAGG